MARPARRKLGDEVSVLRFRDDKKMREEEE